MQAAGPCLGLDFPEQSKTVGDQQGNETSEILAGWNSCCDSGGHAEKAQNSDV